MKAPINGTKARSKRDEVHLSRTKVHAKHMKVHGQVSWADEAERLRTVTCERVLLARDEERR
jgi:hypothetical protein